MFVRDRPGQCAGCTKDSEGKLEFPHSVLVEMLPHCTDTGLLGNAISHPSKTIHPLFPGSCLPQQHQQPVITFQSIGHSCNKIACCTTQQLLIRSFSYSKYRIYFIKQNYTGELHCAISPGQKCSMSLIKRKKMEEKRSNKKLTLMYYRDWRLTASLSLHSSQSY